jgi:cation diffusion facilitator family transporter
MNAKHFVWLSITAALATIALKTGAWWITDSVGLLSDALESSVNLLGAIFALMMIGIAHAPPDDGHPYGHGKAEYFSSGFEGLMIFIAGGAIIVAAVNRLLTPHAIDDVGLGLMLSVVSTLINWGVAVALQHGAKRFESVALDADARHLMTDVMTSVGVVAGVILVAMTGIAWLDPFIAIAVALHIMVEGYRLVRVAVNGLMDQSLPQDKRALVIDALRGFEARGVHYRRLRTRAAGAWAFVDADILVPGQWRVDEAHRVLDEIEAAITRVLPHATITTHLEPDDRN